MSCEAVLIMASRSFVDIGQALATTQQVQDKLKLILEGEARYDIFVRWKPLEQQPIGWDPDLNDGVRLNIRPFVKADVLRKRPNIKWGIDRGETRPEISGSKSRTTIDILRVHRHQRGPACFSTLT